MSYAWVLVWEVLQNVKVTEPASASDDSSDHDLAKVNERPLRGTDVAGNCTTSKLAIMASSCDAL